MRDWHIELPLPKDAFDDRVLPPSYFDGDWPEWAEQTMLDWLPDRICDEFGTCETSVLNGYFLTLDVSRTNEIVNALEQEGYQLRHDPHLISRACGYSFDE